MFAIIRIRGSAGKKKELGDTLKMLRMDTGNSCVIVPETADYKGVIEKLKDIITWGEIDKKTLTDMLKKRLRLKGNKRLNEENLKSITGQNYESFADSLLEGKVRLKDFDQLQPVFKLTPPSKGFKSVLEHYPRGDLGYRGKEINKLVERMI